MTKQSTQRLITALSILFPICWLYLPNIIILYYNNEFGLSLKSIGLLLTIFCTLPLTLLFAKNLRQFWWFNLPFATFAGFYAAYIAYYHDIPYDGIWFALWNTSLDTILGVTYFFRWLILPGLIGVVLYCLCALHPIQKKITFTRSLKQYYFLSSLACIAILLNITNFYSNKIPIQRVIDESVAVKNYPYGMLFMLGKTRVAFSKKQNITLQPLHRSHIPNGRELYVFVIGEAARYDYWLKVSQENHSSLLTDPNIVIFPKTASQANLTSISLPVLLTGTSSMPDAQTHPLWPTIAKAAGCTTGWITNSTEPYNYAYDNDFYDLNVDRHSLVGLSAVVYDDVLASEVQRAITQGAEKLCLVVHLIGSHFDYSERYRADLAKYPVDMNAFYHFSSPEHLESLRNAYLNSLVETNLLLQNLTHILAKENAVSFLLYTSDHAESFDDDDKHQFFHGNINPGQIEMHVPLLIWANAAFQKTYPEKWHALQQNQGRNITNQQIVPTLMDALSISSIPKDLPPSLMQSYETDPERMVLLPQMQLVSLNSLRA